MDQGLREANRLTGWTIVFDLDGTLVESAPDLLNALNHTVGPLGIAPIDLHDIRAMIGRGAKAMIQAAFEAEGRHLEPKNMEALWTSFISHYQSNIAVDSYLFDGVEIALADLKNSGATLSVCTNKTQGLSDQLLNELAVAHLFSSVVGSDSVPAKKPDGGHILTAISRAGGTSRKAIMVGDSRTDEKAAQNAGLPFIFVPFGYEVAAVEDITKSAVLNHYSELLESVLALAG
ncbi:MAG: HAD hydrolase-like protein [Pseudomonadota bacterium]